MNERRVQIDDNVEWLPRRVRSSTLCTKSPPCLKAQRPLNAWFAIPVKTAEGFQFSCGEPRLHELPRRSRISSCPPVASWRGRHIRGGIWPMVGRRWLCIFASVGRSLVQDMAILDELLHRRMWYTRVLSC